ncbi:hypothetical protein ELI13_37975 [Rhizobium ruizarguesonis]|uniref:hypothetical protein n=1 Tax=Rhizobium ruizarguesonis TaxID=2081791 RepID=UPI0010311CE0|nr:hypothetical protein [Rhizobium ruizarguesonis]TAU59272.1 hypothetical protein ELI46_38510 [Rhizobium ruizarguesonis]TAU59324.1 hypothetical protein ELI46_38335 [Rhizobium ruizarguesonis]TAU60958.1 hypothetical protein ELI46_34830 [Rhizobium ruizarguesonis]TAW47957.1 hypothetical protein ELI15_37535 [Rhizobium ruizarguesonis]TAW80982.1 hypothetical protein ELI13_37975 [Rhizobium ruizarguesonis]
MKYPIAMLISALVVAPALALGTSESSPTKKFDIHTRYQPLTGNLTIFGNKAPQWRFSKGVENMTPMPDIQISEDCPCKTPQGVCRKNEDGSYASNC